MQRGFSELFFMWSVAAERWQIRLALTRYCHYQYYMAYIATKGGRGDIIYCAIVWAMGGGEGSAQTKGLFATDSIDSCPKAST